MRTSVPAAAAALILVLLGVPSGARAAAVFVELNPSTVPAGDELSIRASCEDNLKAATVTAEPIGSVTVSPEFGFLTATVRVPADTEPGDYPVALRCQEGGAATSTLHVVAGVEPSRGPATGGGGTAGGATGSMLIGGGLLAVLAGLGLGFMSLRRRRLG
ncbi:hypothetical protein GCM10010112_32480 [Actinoplanes lobatus]|uniref:Gram-positive cocci surface proteins LPxTG domain-containing protein n=1 Tax=Actinoplanes lobatus TaxID=113568 RepID=A0A7W7HEB9_9ACTN|nr:hypothetical protein [Actinoplanes lobatus]MBB4748962.1 hypothetical protein [Actinoplanes lobatus]GGN68287.1 hypothetical protein GCM10010112_32480 [Actinoplanes lobatus]GIE37131.1 hypothetical protein Alo02nite_00290 [Actinoplanes lobatus]